MLYWVSEWATPSTKPLSKLTGVALAGGRSTRLGTDKALLKMNNQLLYVLAETKLNPFCTKVFHSINETQNIPVKNSVIDFYSDQGPLSGILTALDFIKQPILVLAVDMPHISSTTIKELIAKHQPENKVSAYYNEAKQLWEGLVSTWEPSILPDLTTYFKEGGRSLQAFLHQINAAQVLLSKEEEFRSVNTKEDLTYFGLRIN